MIDTALETSLPRPRVVGAVYLLYFIAAFLATFLARGIVVPHQAVEVAGESVQSRKQNSAHVSSRLTPRSRRGPPQLER